MGWMGRGVGSKVKCVVKDHPQTSSLSIWVVMRSTSTRRGTGLRGVDNNEITFIGYLLHARFFTHAVLFILYNREVGAIVTFKSEETEAKVIQVVSGRAKIQTLSGSLRAELLQLTIGSLEM